MASNGPLLRPWHTRALLTVVLLIVGVFCWAVSDLLGSIPSRSELRAFSSMASANILYDIADREVFTIAKEQRIEIPLSQMSPELLKAVIGGTVEFETAPGQGTTVFVRFPAARPAHPAA